MKIGCLVFLRVRIWVWIGEEILGAVRDRVGVWFVVKEVIGEGWRGRTRVRYCLLFCSVIKGLWVKRILEEREYLIYNSKF